MSSIELLTPIFDGGIRNINFFNGRILTAEDLRVEKQANLQQHQQLGQAIGEGVAYGLYVRLGTQSGSRPTVRVASGLAFNRKGQALSLPDELEEVEVALVREKQAIATSAGIFAECIPFEPTTIPTGTGVYILVICPTSGLKERAPKVGLGDGGVARGCDSRYVVEGVQFRLVRLDVNSVSGVSAATRNQLNQLMTQSDVASLSKLRNILAHLCFGTEELTGFLQDPFRRVNGNSPYVTYCALDVLRSLGRLTDCDVPLALIYWTTNGIQLVDIWPVRRRPIPKPLSAMWPLPVSERRLAEAEATFLQFQEHIAQITSPTTLQSQLASIEAVNYFRYLPAAGIIPLGGIKSSRGFDYLKFFNNLTYRNPVFIEGAKLESLIRDSLSYPPIDLVSKDSPIGSVSKELIWLYQVRENMQTIDESTSSPPKPYMIFTSGHIPYQGNARYDLARWDYSNYSKV